MEFTSFRFLSGGSGSEASSVSERLFGDTAGNVTGGVEASGTNVGGETDAEIFVFSFWLLLRRCKDNVFSSAERFCGLGLLETDTEELDGIEKLREYI